MPTHIHAIWQIHDGYVKEKIQMQFQKIYSSAMKFKLLDNKDETLKEFLINAKDRIYQIWERNHELLIYGEKVFIQNNGGFL